MTETTWFKLCAGIFFTFVFALILWVIVERIHKGEKKVTVTSKRRVDMIPEFVTTYLKKHYKNYTVDYSRVRPNYVCIIIILHDDADSEHLLIWRYVEVDGEYKWIGYELSSAKQEHVCNHCTNCHCHKEK